MVSLFLNVHLASNFTSSHLELHCFSLGNCPQFDCVWRNQSVQRHLEFYARLKGLANPIEGTCLLLSISAVILIPSNTRLFQLRGRLLQQSD
jgi:hypothetical protein